METTKKTNWRKEFAPFKSNSDTARELVERERNEPGYLTINEREFVIQVLGREALEKGASR